MMRYALPGIGNNWQVILKATALVSILGLNDVVKATQLAVRGLISRFLCFGCWCCLSDFYHAIQRRPAVAGASLFPRGEEG